MSIKTVTRKEALSLLTQDAYYRELKSWPSLSHESFTHSPIKNTESDDMFTNHYDHHHHNRGAGKLSLTDILKNIDLKHPFTTKLLNEFKGHLVACGGAIAKTIVNYRRSDTGEDIDLFFYNLTVEEATQLRMDIINFLVVNWQIKDKDIKINIQRNQFTTTIFIYQRDNNRFNDEYDHYDTFVYQLIHRIYPDISSILGGFDLPSCCVAYDGNELYATPLGAWSIRNKSIIIDTKRRSTSYEYRLLKYYRYGFTLIFPGLNQSIMNEYVIYPCNRAGDLLEKLSEIALQHGYMIQSHLKHGDILTKLRSEHEEFFSQKQQEANILPFLNINNSLGHVNMDYKDDYDDSKIKIGTNPYKRDLDNRYINKISDYASDSQMYSKYSPHANASRLRANNLDAVVSILEINNDTNIYDILINDAMNPDIKLTESIIEHYKSRVEHVRTPFKYYHPHLSDERLKEYAEFNAYKDFYNLSKCFYKFTNEVIMIRDNDEEYYKYRDMLITAMIQNAKICEDKLKTIKWITQNPGRQWTSSINPIVENPRLWYGDKYIPVLTGIPEEIETCLRLARLRSVWNILDNDVFNIILLYIMKNYADDAWQYI